MKRIAFTIALVLSLGLGSASAEENSVNGTNSSVRTIKSPRFARPLVEKWIEEYAKTEPGVEFQIVKGHPEKQCHELAKMAVTPKAQGRGIGRMLGESLVDYARKHGVRRIYLEGNTRLEASIALYRKLGFHEIPLQGNAYERCDILMLFDLDL